MFEHVCFTQCIIVYNDIILSLSSVNPAAHSPHQGTIWLSGRGRT